MAVVGNPCEGCPLVGGAGDGNVGRADRPPEAHLDGSVGLLGNVLDGRGLSEAPFGGVGEVERCDAPGGGAIKAAT